MSLWQAARERNDRFGKTSSTIEDGKRKHLTLAVLYVSLGALLTDTEELCSVQLLRNCHHISPSW